MSLIQNERTKLLAGALDRASTVCLGVGVAPLIAGLAMGAQGVSATLVVTCYGWFVAAVGLHLAARWVLGRLEE